MKEQNVNWNFHVKSYRNYYGDGSEQCKNTVDPVEFHRNIQCAGFSISTMNKLDIYLYVFDDASCFYHSVITYSNTLRQKRFILQFCSLNRCKTTWFVGWSCNPGFNYEYALQHTKPIHFIIVILPSFFLFELYTCFF